MSVRLRKDQIDKTSRILQGCLLLSSQWPLRFSHQTYDAQENECKESPRIKNAWKQDKRYVGIFFSTQILFFFIVCSFFDKQFCAKPYTKQNVNPILSKSYLSLLTVPSNPGNGKREYLLITNRDKELASNSMDQHAYSHIASLVVVELDCIQFDYIHWAELGGNTEEIETLALRC